jgi:hypothetical protein
MQQKLKKQQQLKRLASFLKENQHATFLYLLKSSANLGTVFGVYLPCVQNIFGKRSFFVYRICVYMVFI